MPYTTERGVTSYHDRDTPPEYATSQDEDADRFNKAVDRAYETTDTLTVVLDGMRSDSVPDKAGEMSAIADALDALLVRAHQITG